MASQPLSSSAVQIAYTTQMCTNKKTPDCIATSKYEFLEACEKHNVYERIPNDGLIHPYFDVDYKEEAAVDGQGNKIAFSNTMEPIFIECAKRFLARMMSQLCEGLEPEFCILSSTSPDYLRAERDKTSKVVSRTRTWKVSLHIIVVNALITRVQLAALVKLFNYVVARQEMATLVDYGCDFLEEFFDPNPYGTNQKVRALYSSKDGENRPLVLVEGTPEGTIITNTDPVGEHYVIAMETKAIQATLATLQGEDDDAPMTTNRKPDGPPDMEKYHAYMSLIPREEFGTYMGWWKVQRASANIGIPFEEYDKHMQGCAGYDYANNYSAYQASNDDAKGRLGWRYILSLAAKYSPEEKQALDEKYGVPKFEYAKKERAGVFSDLEASRKLYTQLYPHWKFCEKRLYAFDDTTGMWSDSKAVHDAIIIRFSDDLHVATIEKKKGDEKGVVVVSPTRSYGNTENLRNKMYSGLAALSRDDDWLKQNQLSSLKKLLFRNGYFDAAEGKFYHKDVHGFNPDILFFACIPHDYEEFDEEELAYMASIKQRLFRDPLGQEQGDFLLLNIARGLMGDMMKRFIMGIGTTNSGKSILTTAIQIACGKYAATFNAENLAMRNNSDGDEAKAMRWMLLLRHTRVILSNELKSNTALSGNMLKKMSSGGDTLCGRTHGQEETEFIMQALPVLFANDVPDIKPYDEAVDARLRVVSFKKSFVDAPSNEFELKKDPNLENEIRTLRFQKALVGLFIREYMHAKEFGVPEEPADVLAAKKEWVGDEADPLGRILEQFEVSNSPADYVRSSHIEKTIEALKIDMKMRKFGSLMAKYTTLKKLEHIKNGQKKIAGKNVAVWFGLKEVKEEEEEAEEAQGTCFLRRP